MWSSLRSKAKDCHPPSYIWTQEPLNRYIMVGCFLLLLRPVLSPSLQFRFTSFSLTLRSCHSVCCWKVGYFVLFCPNQLVVGEVSIALTYSFIIFSQQRIYRCISLICGCRHFTAFIFMDVESWVAYLCRKVTPFRLAQQRCIRSI